MSVIFAKRLNLTYRILPLLFFCFFLLPALASKAFAQGGDASKPPLTRPTVKSGTGAKKTGRAPQPNGGTVNPAERHYTKGSMLLGKNDPVAETELREAVRLAPNKAEYHAMLGNALNNQQKFTEAEIEFREAVRIAPNNSYYHENLSDILLAQQKFTEAELESGKAVRLAPNEPSTHVGHGESLDGLKKYSEAEAEYREAIRLSPKYELGWDRLAQNLEKQNKLVEAEAARREVIRIRPENGYNFHALANNLFLQRKWAEAETQCREALRYASRDGYASGYSPTSQAAFHNLLGVVLSQQGKRTEAAVELREAVRLDPNNKTIQGNLNSVQ